MASQPGDNRWLMPWLPGGVGRPFTVLWNDQLISGVGKGDPAGKERGEVLEIWQSGIGVILQSTPLEFPKTNG